MTHLHAVIIGGLCSGLIACGVSEAPFREDYENFRSIARGQTEEEVRKRLGAPDRTYSKGVSPATYCQPGYSCDQREITHKLFVYVSAEPVAYIYFDAENRVEHVYVGGS